jgi:hypothetical protein
MFEHRHEPLLPRSEFYRRMLVYSGFATAIIVISLLIGILGYHYFEGLAWIDALVNASMLLGGMGPVDTDLSPAGKVFAGAFALYAGLVFVVAAGVLLAPVVHRILHSVHCDLE